VSDSMRGIEAVADARRRLLCTLAASSLATPAVRATLMPVVVAGPARERVAIRSEFLKAPTVGAQRSDT
jgi:hypothetical protein